MSPPSYPCSTIHDQPVHACRACLLQTQCYLLLGMTAAYTVLRNDRADSGFIAHLVALLLLCSVGQHALQHLDQCLLPVVCRARALDRCQRSCQARLDP